MDHPDGVDSGWLAARPPEHLTTARLRLDRARDGDRTALVDAVNRSLAELRPWMPWAQEPATDATIGAFLTVADEGWETGTEFQYALRPLVDDGPSAILGFAGLHASLGPGALEIGYWVRSDAAGRGFASEAAGALAGAALALPGVHRAEIHCDSRNSRSAAVAERLGFRLARVDRRAPLSPTGSAEVQVWTWPADP